MLEKNGEEQNAVSGVIEALEELNELLDTLQGRIDDCENLGIELLFGSGSDCINTNNIAKDTELVSARIVVDLIA